VTLLLAYIADDGAHAVGALSHRSKATQRHIQICQNGEGPALGYVVEMDLGRLRRRRSAR